MLMTIDLFPTILSLVGLDPTRFTLNGRDLVPWIQAGAAPPTPLLAETSMSGDTRYALRDGHYKLIQPYRLDFGGEMKINRPEEMFELTVDPGEQRNLAVPPSAQLEALRQELSRRIDLVRRERAAAGGRSRSKALSPQERDRLRSLGYIN